MKLTDLRQNPCEAAHSSQAAIARIFFKTGPGESGEGDHFPGLKVPQSGGGLVKRKP
ncbi:MAG TPA: hypothetical protein PK490_12510 [Prosthecobacter sp.]|nr:hypothetical protein [Prosthecobacter sp.]HRK15108.1 hypothetical protein [Prosthecobacter sp.]